VEARVRELDKIPGLDEQKVLNSLLHNGYW
jgi:hypothetical protein